jgi:hypothetical protein
VRQKGDKERQKRERAGIDILSQRKDTVPGKKEILWKIYRRDRVRNHVAKIDNRKFKMNKIQFNC